MTFRPNKLKSILLCAVLLLLAAVFTVSAAQMLGDADCDGEVLIIDVTCIQKHIAEIPLSGEFSEYAANVDGNEIIDVRDVTLIQKWLAKIDTPYDIGVEPTQAPTQAPTQRQTDANGWIRDIFQP